MAAARDALNRFLSSCSTPRTKCSSTGSTQAPDARRRLDDRQARPAARRSRRMRPRGGTAMYDAVAEAVPLAQTGRHRKKALLIISDGNDTSSHTDVPTLKRMIRETEVLVYAIGIDSQTDPRCGRGASRCGASRPGHPPLQRAAAARADPVPVSDSPAAAGAESAADARRPSRRRRAATTRGGSDEGVNVAALRDITDDSGGRTEIIREPARPRSGNRRHRRRAEQAVLPRLRVNRRQGRALAHDPRRGPEAGYIVRARRGFVATP